MSTLPDIFFTHKHHKDVTSFKFTNFAKLPLLAYMYATFARPHLLRSDATLQYDRFRKLTSMRHARLTGIHIDYI